MSKLNSVRRSLPVNELSIASGYVRARSLGWRGYLSVPCSIEQENAIIDLFESKRI